MRSSPLFSWILSRPGDVKRRDKRFLPLFPLAREGRTGERIFLSMNTLHPEITPSLRENGRRDKFSYKDPCEMIGHEGMISDTHQYFSSRLVRRL